MTATKLQDGTFVVHDGGTWLPGVYETAELANVAIDFMDDELKRRWELVLADGRDVMTFEDLFGKK